MSSRHGQLHCQLGQLDSRIKKGIPDFDKLLAVLTFCERVLSAAANLHVARKDSINECHFDTGSLLPFCID
jgi:hypothetical protein